MIRHYKYHDPHIKKKDFVKGSGFGAPIQVCTTLIPMAHYAFGFMLNMYKITPLTQYVKLAIQHLYGGLLGGRSLQNLLTQRVKITAPPPVLDSGGPTQ